MRVQRPAVPAPTQACGSTRTIVADAAAGIPKAGNGISRPVTYFSYKNRELHAEGVPLGAIAEKFGTPCFVYSRAALTNAYRAFDMALKGHKHLICYALKANSNIAILNLLKRLGSGFDIVSGGELERVLMAGGEARKVVFSGVGKSEAEIRYALEAGILCFNVESESELLRINRIAEETGKPASVSLRVNPDIDAGTHPYIATGLKNDKFGIPYHEALKLYGVAARLKHLKVTGIGCHIGSQITDLAPFVAGLEKVLRLVERLEAQGIPISHLDLGGGLGIRYHDETPPSIAEYVSALIDLIGERPQTLLVEPGRTLVGNAGILLTRVEYLKHGDEKNFAVIDAAMNDLIRPALYDAYHEIVEVREPGGTTGCYQVVGPVCESGDFLGRDRTLAIAEGDLLAILSAGAYGMSMSSNYNSRPRSPEVMVDDATTYLIRERESVAELTAREIFLP